ncbi:MAG: diguanylate cyclase, partial [Pseudobdellovibrionaceae bacterium]
MSQPSAWKVFDNLMDAVFIVDSEKRLYFVNECFRHLCEVPLRAVAQREDVTKFINLPDSLWTILSEAPGSNEPRRYREVEFTTKTGMAGKVQALNDYLPLEPLTGNAQLYFFVLRDVTLEVRLQSKYKEQIANNEHLIGELQRNLSETAFLRKLAMEFPMHAELAALLSAIGSRLKSELGFREAHFIKVTGKGLSETASKDMRVGSRLREVLNAIEPTLFNRQEKGGVSSLFFEPFGTFWITILKPKLEKPLILITSGAEPSESQIHKGFLETLSGQVCTLLDNRVLYIESITDPLSGLFNRRFFDSRLSVEGRISFEERAPLSLVLIDIDHFKKVNDTYGHPVGDQVIKAISELIRKRIRNTDYGVRVGGEEFALILPSTNAQDAKNLAEFLRTHIEKMSVPLEDGKSFSVTISCGIAEFDWSERSADLLYKTT